MKKTNWRVNERRLYWEIGYRISAMRDMKGWTQAGLAARVKLSRVYVAQIEGARNRIPLHALYVFADVFDVEVTKLLPSLTAVRA